jgi:hypothetical protein
MARVTGLEPATFGVTGRRSNQLSYTRVSVDAAVRRGAKACQETYTFHEKATAADCPKTIKFNEKSSSTEFLSFREALPQTFVTLITA